MPSPLYGYRNRLLRALPPGELAGIRPRLEPVTFSRGDVVQAFGQTIEHAYFVESGMVSIVTTLSDGDVFAVGSVGPAGMVGAGLLRYEPVSLIEGVGQIAGTAFRLPRRNVLEALASCPAFRVQAQRYRDLQYSVAFESAACMARHGLSQRLPRWLLEASDAVESLDFQATQEDIARLLGVCRPTLSVAAGALQDAGLIRFCRGRITLADRGGLEHLACGCYESLRGRHAHFAAGPRSSRHPQERGAA